MSGVESELIEQFAKKLGHGNDEHLIEKSTELVRLLQLKSSKLIGLDASAKAVLCIDVAASLLGYVVDQPAASKLSNLRNTYANHKRNVEKILDISKVVGINEICTRLEIVDSAKEANLLLEIYKKSVYENSCDIDFTHPQYAAMAVYCTLKPTQAKSMKSKLMRLSQLTSTQWIKLHKEWTKTMEKNYSNETEKKTSKPEKSNKDVDTKAENKTHLNKEEPEIEDYKTWKKRMLTRARDQLNEKVA